MASHPIILLSTALLLILFPHSHSAQNIAVGTSLTAAQNSNAWPSSNGDFAFGFRPLQSNNSLFVLSIWFDKIPDKTIVWFERTSFPVPRGSTVRLDAADGLVLRDPQGQVLYNTTGGGPANQVAYALMNDTGNLVIRSNDSSILWESFRNPADTILPTQTIEINRMLISRKTEDDFSTGRFYARISHLGDLVFNTKRSAPWNLDQFDDEYFSSFTSSGPGGNASDPGVRLVFSDTALIYILRRSGRQHIISPGSIPLSSDNYYRATLDVDGVFTQYYHPRTFGNPQWFVADSWPDNICEFVNGDKGSGACGYNSVCRIQNRRPNCQCPPRFSLADSNNPYGDCTPMFVQSCIHGDQMGSSQDEYNMSFLSDTDWPKNDYEEIKPSTDEQCKSACLNDCFCAVAIHRDDTCWKKKLPLTNGKFDTSLSSKAFLKMRKRDIPPPNPGLPNPGSSRPRRDRQTVIVVISVFLGSSVFVNFVFITAACVLLSLIYNNKLSAMFPARGTLESNLRCFTYKELVQATNGFEEELGRGAFGIVYKGVMQIGSKSLIAVKKLDRVIQDSDKEFKTEVNVIGQTHHKNLVCMIGFCNEGPHRLLVYEYMSNGTLAEFLFGDLRPSWSQRIQIALGIARGLTYLHEECSSQIIHCDIKPQNILLDEYYAARISDFGLAKLLAMNQSKTLTNIRGTKGYVAPEWFRNTQITVKVDVYSFGVVLLEIIACRKIMADLEFGEGENPILTDWAWECFIGNRLDELVRNEEEAIRDGKTLERFVMVGLWCIQEDASLRPTMKRACQMLEGTVEVPMPPNSSSFTSVA